MYTALSRERRLVALVGSAKAVTVALKSVESHRRVVTLRECLVRNAALASVRG